MSGLQLVLLLLRTDPVRSLVVEAGKALLAQARNGHAAATHIARTCPQCGWMAKSEAARRRDAARVVVAGRARLLVPGLRDDPQRVAEVESALLRLEGVSEARANPLTGRVLVLYDPAVVDLPAIGRALEGATTPELGPARFDWNASVPAV